MDQNCDANFCLQETHDEQKIVNSVYAPILWFGNDPNPPADIVEKPPEPAPPVEAAPIAISCENLSLLGSML
jgi:hypothetical protein